MKVELDSRLDSTNVLLAFPELEELSIRLDLDEHKIGEEPLLGLSRLKNLRSLELSGLNMGVDLSLLSCRESLTDLTTFSFRVDEEWFEALAGFTNLESLTLELLLLEDRENVDDVPLLLQLSRLKNLRRLTFTDPYLLKEEDQDEAPAITALREAMPWCEIEVKR